MFLFVLFFVFEKKLRFCDCLRNVVMDVIS